MKYDRLDIEGIIKTLNQAILSREKPEVVSRIEKDLRDCFFSYILDGIWDPDTLINYVTEKLKDLEDQLNYTTIKKVYQNLKYVVTLYITIKLRVKFDWISGIKVDSMEVKPFYKTLVEVIRELENELQTIPEEEKKKELEERVNQLKELLVDELLYE